MAKHTKVIDGTIQIKSVLDWVFAMISKGLQGGAVAIDIYRYEELRTVEQNEKQWPMYNDISEQIDWYGQKLTPENWKELLSNEWQAQTIVPGISGGFCALGVRTSKMKKREMSELIEIIYAFGANKNVVWSEKSIASYQSYKEAQQ
jgi:hypothetical protein